MKELTTEEMVFKAKLEASCLSRCRVKVEILPYGYCQGSVSTFVERQIVGWHGGMTGVGNLSQLPLIERRKK